MAAPRDASGAPTVIERFIKALVVAVKAVMLYPLSSNVPLQTAEAATVVLREALQERSELVLGVSKAGLLYDGELVFSGNAAYQSFAYDLYRRRLAEIRFHAGVQPKDLVSFLSLLKDPPEEIESGGGFEARLWELGVTTITVTDMLILFVNAEMDEMQPVPDYSKEQIDEILASAQSGRAHDQVVIARFMSEGHAVADYLMQIEAAALGEDSVHAAAERFLELASIAAEVGDGSAQARLAEALGAALGEVDSDLRRKMLIEELLPQAKDNQVLGDVLRGQGTQGLCRMVLQGIDESTPAADAARAIRAVGTVTMAQRDELLSVAAATLRETGVSEAYASQVIQAVSPGRVEVAGETAPAGQRPADTIMSLMDLAPAASGLVAPSDEPELERLAEEAREGITDGDIIAALVALLSLDRRPVQFASTMAMLENSLDVLIERGDMAVAADAADALMAMTDDPELTQEQKARVQGAIGRFGKTGDIRAIAVALRAHPPGSAEHLAARRLLDALGGLAFEPLLEELARESDMAMRKNIVDLLTAMADGHIRELGSYVSDSRWYVVRNVVSILGSTHTSASLPYLERTLRHAEPRVRRESIRAIAGIVDRIAHELLIAALTDPDPQNVQLAARYLGVAKVRSAVASLEQVARGEGRGSRDTGPRVEAIESLGRMGATEALPTLAAIAGRRGIIGGARTRELRTAAEAAIGRIKAGGVAQ